MTDNRPTIFVPIAPPGAGKSTYFDELRKKYPDICHLSSDELRGKLFGNVNDQTHNSAVFAEMGRLTVEAIKAGRSVYYDATNTGRSKRMTFIRNMRDRLKNSPCDIIGIVFTVPVEECKKHNALRERHVGEKTYRNMLGGFCVPLMSEGFDSIEFLTHDIHNELPDCNISQDNKHHKLTVLEHMKLAAENLKDSDNELLKIAARYHDIGKPATKAFHTHGGKPTEDAHYIGHHCYGAYILMSNMFGPEECMAPEFRNLSTEDKIKILTYVEFHMAPFGFYGSEEHIRALIGDSMYDDILEFHEADNNAKQKE